jgi:hypothetical protein
MEICCGAQTTSLFLQKDASQGFFAGAGDALGEAAGIGERGRGVFMDCRFSNRALRLFASSLPGSSLRAFSVSAIELFMSSFVSEKLLRIR